ncbi:hypothetical protein IC575_009671 [Cucumis melo]
MVISSFQAISPAKSTAFIKSYCINYGSHSLRKWVDTSIYQTWNRQEETRKGGRK